MKEVFGIDVPFDLAKFNGTLDRQNSWDVVREFGAREEFLKKFPAYVDGMHNSLSNEGRSGAVYADSSAVSLCSKTLQK